MYNHTRNTEDQGMQKPRSKDRTACAAMRVLILNVLLVTPTFCRPAGFSSTFVAVVFHLSRPSKKVLGCQIPEPRRGNSKPFI
jgi:hypothetical protein